MKLFFKSKKTNKWFTILLILLVALILVSLYNQSIERKEGFAQREKFVVKHNDSLYDEFYSRIYNKLFMNENKVEIEEVLRALRPKKNSYFLDIGSGNGNTINVLNKKGFRVMGLDSSKAMIESSKEKYPDLKVKHGDALQSIQFSPNTFDNILCLYFTVYYMKNKSLFFENCFNWLKPGGYLAVHLVNRDKFDPIIPASDPLFIVSPQKHAPKRITNSVVKFYDFQYKSNFRMEKDKNKCYFEETFKDDATGNVRKNVHTLYMDTQKNILSLAKEEGFVFKGKVDMTRMQYNYQYVYILQKPK